MAKKALFVIDVQAEFVSIPSTAIPHAARICEAGGAILDRARRISSAELEIIVVQHCEDASDPNATLIPGNKEWELALPPQEGVKNERVVRKTTGNTFESNPSLANELKDQGVATVVAFGIQSEQCVRATCRGAVNAGFEVVLLQGAHSTYDNADTGESAEDIEKSVDQELRSIGVQIVPWDQYTF